MHYRHRYHAGNFADVFKHVLLVGLIQALCRKDTPWSFLDTHAGAGDYDLHGADATRTGEWQGGIGRLLGLHEAPSLIAEYLALVRGENPGGEIRSYPGSPRLVQRLARPQDRLVLCERVAEVAAELKQFNRGDARIAVHVRDGYEAAALLPPAEKRGLVLIDPPFERTDEYAAVADCIARCAARFPGGIYAAWYPVKNRHEAARFLRRLARDSGRPLLDARLDIGAVEVSAPPPGSPVKHPLTACGLAIVNPPFGLEETAAAAVHFLGRRLAQGEGAHAICEIVKSEP